MVIDNNFVPYTQDMSYEIFKTNFRGHVIEFVKPDVRDGSEVLNFRCFSEKLLENVDNDRVMVYKRVPRIMIPLDECDNHTTFETVELSNIRSERKIGIQIDKISPHHYHGLHPNIKYHYRHYSYDKHTSTGLEDKVFFYNWKKMMKDIDKALNILCDDIDSINSEIDKLRKEYNIKSVEK